MGLELDRVYFTRERAVRISFNSISCRWLSPVIANGLSSRCYYQTGLALLNTTLLLFYCLVCLFLQFILVF